jgi:glycosyltransferase involved in cell wall biosynthesis
VICGGPAYMMGQRHLARLRELAAKLRRTRVVFAGHVTGLRKAACFRMADVYVFPSRHDSYGLTLMEALSWGCGVVALDSAGAREVLGEAVCRESEFRAGLGRALAAGRPAARAPLLTFAGQAARLADQLFDRG